MPTGYWLERERKRKRGKGKGGEKRGKRGGKRGKGKELKPTIHSPLLQVATQDKA